LQTISGGIRFSKVERNDNINATNSLIYISTEHTGNEVGPRKASYNSDTPTATNSVT
jgi:hypothetical protein